jgi:hypothetical protein
LSADFLLREDSDGGKMGIFLAVAFTSWWLLVAGCVFFILSIKYSFFLLLSPHALRLALYGIFMFN